MHLLIPSLLLYGLLCSLVTAVPSPQWLYQQIHALPEGKSDHVTDEMHIKKSEIPEHKKRKDGVKRLFNFLDSAIQESGSGSGEGSAQDTVTMTTGDHSGLTGLTEKPVNGDENKKQEEISNSPDAAQQKAKVAENLTNEHLASAKMAKTSFTGYGQQVSSALPAVNPQNTQVPNQYAAASQQEVQRAYYAPQRTAGFGAYGRQHTSTYSPNISPYARSMQAQKTIHGYQVAAGQQPQPYGYTASRTRPPAIPVRSQVTANVLRAQLPLATAQRFVGGPHRSNVQGPVSFTMTITGLNEYGGYNADAHGIPAAEGKSQAALQERPYGQLKRQRYNFHQQTRALIPGRVPVRTYTRYPYPIPPANFPGQVRGIIHSRLPYQRAKPIVSREQMPFFQRPVVAPPNPARFPGQVYYRNGIPQRKANLAYAAPMMRSHGYPLITRPLVGRAVTRVGRAVINRKPQPRNVVTSLTAAAARLVVPARPEANEKSATAEIAWSSSVPQPGAHAIRSNTHP